MPSGRERGLHAAAEGALEVAEHDDGHERVGRTLDRLLRGDRHAEALDAVVRGAAAGAVAFGAAAVVVVGGRDAVRLVGALTASDEGGEVVATEYRLGLILRHVI